MSVWQILMFLLPPKEMIVSPCIPCALASGISWLMSG